MRTLHINISKLSQFFLLMSSFLLYRTVQAASECTVNGQVVDCAELGGMIKGFIALGLGTIFILFALGILALIFWIMMLVHAAQQEVANKAMWIILMVFFGVVASIVYYFVVKRPFDKTRVQVKESVSQKIPKNKV